MDVGIIVFKGLTLEGFGVGVEVIGAYYFVETIKIRINSFRVLPYGQTIREDRFQLRNLSKPPLLPHG